MNLIKKHYHIVFLILISLLLFILNYTPHTWLMGWDNIMPEFNIGLNMHRAFFAVWQEYRGLGVYDGMAHAANLMHTIYIALLSLAIPTSMLRYVFMLLTHLIGGIGFYVLMTSFRPSLTREKSQTNEMNEISLRLEAEVEMTKGSSEKFTMIKNKFINKYAAFAGALFYMFNLGIMQMYSAPLEVFAVHFAALPILSLLLLKSLQGPTKKNLLLLFVGNFLLSSQGFVPTVFIAYLILVMSILIIKVIFIDSRIRGNDKGSILHSLSSILCPLVIILLANSFWLLPYLYGVRHTAPVIQSARINEFSSDELFARNMARGDLLNVIQMKGFMLDTPELNVQTRKYDFLMAEWIRHSASPLYILLYGIVSVIALIGIEASFRKKYRIGLVFYPALLMALFFLANNTPFLSQLNTLLRTVLPVLGEALRIPFTKFITLFAFTFSVFFTIGASYIGEKLKKTQFIFFLFLASAILYLSLPAFNGYFFSPYVKVSVPNSYLQLINYFKQQDNTKRIVLLPAQTFWNWQYRNWGYRGSDFLWYGIPQPILERSFDPWSNYNEQFYNELSYAFTTDNTDLFNNTLEKYDISYLLLDTTIITDSATKPINYDKIIDFIDRAKNVTKEKEFGPLIVYSLKTVGPVYTVPPDTIRLSPIFSNGKKDLQYATFGTYIVDNNNAGVIYPFASLYTEKLPKDQEFSATETNDKIILTSKKSINDSVGKSMIVALPSLLDTEYLLPIIVTVRDKKLIITLLYPTISIGDTQFQHTAEVSEIPLNVVTSPTKITSVDGEIEYLPGIPNYVKNGTTTIFRVLNNSQEELVEFDPEIMTRQTLFAEFVARDNDSIVVENKKITSQYSLEHPLKNNNFETNINPESFKNQYICNQAKALATKTPDQLMTLETICNTLEIASYNGSMPHAASYIGFVYSRYISGLPLQLYIDNPFEKRAELETKMSKINDVTTFVLPPSEQFFEGYGFHLISKSIGNTVSISRGIDYNVYPYPAEFVQNIRLYAGSDSFISFLQGSDPFKSGKKPVTYARIAPYLFITSTDNSTGYVVLSQAYDPGWKAFQIFNFQFPISNWVNTYFPFIFGKELKEHVLVNNWANGWFVDNSQSKVESLKSNIIVLFWPQYLEIFGFLLGLGCLGWLGFGHVRKYNVK